MIRVNATSPIHVFQENKQDKQWSSPFKYLAFNHVPFNHIATAHGNEKSYQFSQDYQYSFLIYQTKKTKG